MRGLAGFDGIVTLYAAGLVEQQRKEHAQRDPYVPFRPEAVALNGVILPFHQETHRHVTDPKGPGHAHPNRHEVLVVAVVGAGAPNVAPAATTWP